MPLTPTRYDDLLCTLNRHKRNMTHVNNDQHSHESRGGGMFRVFNDSQLEYYSNVVRLFSLLLS